MPIDEYMPEEFQTWFNTIDTIKENVK
jgi:hypothetical protein